MDLAAHFLRSTLGISVLLGICWIFSSHKRQIDWNLVIKGMALQVILALIVLKLPFARIIFQAIVDGFLVLIRSTNESAQFMFGDLAKSGAPFGFAFTVLPTIVFFSAFSSLLYYWGILQKVVFLFAKVMKKTMRLSGAESLAAAANVFIGQTEAPLVVKPYLATMTRSEILSLMTGGMATIAGGVFGAYIAMLGGDDIASQQKFGLHLLSASIISAPAAIVAAKILFPEIEPEKIDDTMEIPQSDIGSNFLDALSRGTTEGVKLAVNVGAMLLAFMAFIFMSNIFLNWVGEITQLNPLIAANSTFDGLSLQYIMGYIFAPIAWLIGIDGQEVLYVGSMLGEKTILNEFVAYLSLRDLITEGMISERAAIITTYALCGFANFASIGIQIGGIGGLAPNQRITLTEAGGQALIGGTVASLLTACIAGLMV